MTTNATHLTAQADQNGTVTLTLTKEQAAHLANTIDWNVDLETVELDNGEPERAAFLVDLRDRLLAL